MKKLQNKLWLSISILVALLAACSAPPALRPQDELMAATVAQALKSIADPVAREDLIVGLSHTPSFHAAYTAVWYVPADGRPALPPDADPALAARLAALTAAGAAGPVAVEAGGRRYAAAPIILSGKTVAWCALGL